ncbi:MAG: SsrA-binding protein SmpB [Thermodesulfobacteriota bacterium]
MSIKIVAKNKKAFHDYHIDKKIETGIVLVGPEVKSLRAGRANLRDSYARIKNGEVWVHNLHISPYKYATHASPDPLRVRKLLLHKREISKLIGKVQEKGFSLIPLKLYFTGKGKVKLELGLAKGKTQYDKRQTLKKKEASREMDRIRKDYR